MFDVLVACESKPTVRKWLSITQHMFARHSGTELRLTCADTCPSHRIHTLRHHERLRRPHHRTTLTRQTATLRIRFAPSLTVRPADISPFLHLAVSRVPQHSAVGGVVWKVRGRTTCASRSRLENCPAGARPTPRQRRWPSARTHLGRTAGCLSDCLIGKGKNVAPADVS